MKVKVTAILLFVAIALVTPYAAQSQSEAPIVINEYDLNPVGNDNSKSVIEWVELYNRTNYDINISGWTVESTHGARTGRVVIPQGTILEAGGYYVLGQGSQWLDNTEMIILRNASGNEIDRTAETADDDGDAWTWQRCPNGFDSDSFNDWKFRVGTQGEANNCG